MAATTSLLAIAQKHNIAQSCQQAPRPDFLSRAGDVRVEGIRSRENFVQDKDVGSDVPVGKRAGASLERDVTAWASGIISCKDVAGADWKFVAVQPRLTDLLLVEAIGVGLDMCSKGL